MQPMVVAILFGRRRLFAMLSGEEIVMTEHETSFEAVKAYYGAATGAGGLATKACTCGEQIPSNHQAILAQIDREILDRFYGCGSPIPPCIEGCTVLDVGCGAGRDAYLASRLVGPTGRVIGVDMTAEQLAVARRHQAAQAERFGLARSNVDFREGRFEDLAALGVADASVDVVISNCAVNLSPRKERVFSEIFRVLKPGGELYFSDVFADRRPPPMLREDPVLLGECLAGAMYVEDFRRMLRNLGCPDHRLVSRSRTVIDNPAVEARVGGIGFESMTIRAFKLRSLEDACEDYGQMAIYLGSVPEHPHVFPLDDHHLFQALKPALVCGNTAAMVSETRYSRHFHMIGDRSRHFGRFDCGAAPAAVQARSGGACC
jgi:arsenite methyltransferase